MSLASPRVVNIKDLRRLARARLPDAVFDYLDGAADDEVTLKDSEKAFREVLFKPRFAVATPACDLGVTVLGHKLDLPFMLGPIGYSRLMHPRGELAASAASLPSSISRPACRQAVRPRVISVCMSASFF